MSASGAIYETGPLLAQYLLLHYGEPSDISPHASPPRDALDFPARCARACIEFARPGRNARALDLGCAVGRSTFELARSFKEALGIDYSRQFIDACNALRRDGRLEYRFPVEGDITAPGVAAVPPDAPRQGTRFEHGDASRLPPGLGLFDAALLANLLDRLPDPGACLAQLPGILAPGAILVITTPCTWLEEFTPRARWLGGRDRPDGPLFTAEALHDALGPCFDLIDTRDMPFLIREHARKFQWSVALTTIWRRKE